MREHFYLKKKNYNNSNKQVWLISIGAQQRHPTSKIVHADDERNQNRRHEIDLPEILTGA